MSSGVTLSIFFWQTERKIEGESKLSLKQTDKLITSSSFPSMKHATHLKRRPEIRPFLTSSGQHLMKEDLADGRMSSGAERKRGGVTARDREKSEREQEMERDRESEMRKRERKD